MISATIAQGVGLLLWFVALALAWGSFGLRRRLPAALIWPGLLALAPLAFVLRGMLGDPGFALPALVFYAGGPPLRAGGRGLLAALVAAALTLYASALGFIGADLYGAGYFPAAGMAAVGALLLAAYACLPALAWSWLLGLALFASGLHPSPNLWDTLVDLPSVILALAIVVRKSGRSAAA